MISIIDYGRGNLYSIEQALLHFGVECRLVDDAKAISHSNCIVLPGVGAFGDAAAKLRRNHLDEAIREAAGKGAYVLGICLGAQLLLSRSMEFGEHAGLDLIKGTVRRLPEPSAGADGMTRIPNVGWRVVTSASDENCSLPIKMMYFVHSYAPFVCDRKNISGTTHINGVDVPVAIQQDKIFGCQFHPEKSGPTGSFDQAVSRNCRL